jgi:periplasmic protein TonB
MHRMLRLFLCAGLLAGCIIHAQQPALMNGAQAVRFEQSPGFFHYVVFCKTPKESMAQMPAAKLPPDSMEYALCWYASTAAGGDGSQAVDGRVVVSEHHVRFVPADPQFAEAYVDLPREQAELTHQPGQPIGTLLGKGRPVRFRFTKLCVSCAAGTQAPPGTVPALLDQEFELLDETIRHFYSGWKQIYRLSSGAPANSPSGGQPRDAVASGPRPSQMPLSAAASRPDAVSSSNSASMATPRGTSLAAAPSPSTLDRAANRGASNMARASAPLVIGGPRGKPVKIGSEAADGRLIKKVPPDYPLEAKLVRLEGTVVLRAVIDKAGEVSEVNAVSGPALLESAAVGAVKQWQYRPYLLNGQPVDVETTIDVTFALDGTRPVNRTRASASRQ